MNFKPFSKKQLKVLCWWNNQSDLNLYDAIICDGAVRSGKTLCMSLSFVFWAMTVFNDTSFAICGKTVASLKRNVITPLITALSELGFTCVHKESKNLLIVNYGSKQNRFYLFGGKDESSAALIQGITLGGIMLDEVALMPRSFVEQAVARCSVEGSRLWFNCNPEHPHHWFYKEWILKSKEKNALYIHFEMKDNPSLSKNMIRRYESLYSGAFYERFIKGKWVATEGLIYPFFDASFLTEPPPSAESYCISCDYGTINPFSLGLWAKYRDRWFRVAEYYYSSKQSGEQKTDEEYYKALLSLANGKKIDMVVVDPSAASFIEVIKRHGQFNVKKAKNDVISGIRQVGDALKSKRINICHGCNDAIREFSLYKWDTDAANDRPIKENDHAMDDIRYFVATVLNKSEDSLFVFSSARKTIF